MPVVARELLAGSRHFNDLRRGILLISPATLSQRLRELVDAGVLDRTRAEGRSGRVEYCLTEAGEKLRPIIRSFGVWGERWARHEIRREDVDPHLLIWAMHRHLHLKVVPADRVVLQFEFPDVEIKSRRFWYIIDPPRARGRVPQKSRSRGGPDARDEHPDDDDGLPGSARARRCGSLGSDRPRRLASSREDVCRLVPERRFRRRSAPCGSSANGARAANHEKRFAARPPLGPAAGRPTEIHLSTGPPLNPHRRYCDGDGQDDLQAGRFDAIAVVRELGPTPAQRAAAHDADDTFVADSYADFKKRKLFSAGVPAELGGGGATFPELCAMLQEIGRCCGSSALALSRHTHTLATTLWFWKHGTTAVEPLLRRIAAEELILVSSGGSDWLDGCGKAERVDGGFRVSGRKSFASGSPSGQLLLTTAVYVDPAAGATVLHLPVPLDAPGVRIHHNWRTLGMRATGSNDVTIEGVFVPEGAVGVRRPKGEWNQFFDVISPLVQPLIMSEYMGVAESARPLALAQAAKKRDDPITQGLVGEMDTHLAAAQIALREMVALGSDYDC